MTELKFLGSLRYKGATQQKCYLFFSSFVPQGVWSQHVCSPHTVGTTGAGSVWYYLFPSHFYLRYEYLSLSRARDNFVGFIYLILVKRIRSVLWNTLLSTLYNFFQKKHCFSYENISTRWLFGGVLNGICKLSSTISYLPSLIIILLIILNILNIMLFYLEIKRCLIIPLIYQL